MLWVGIPRRAVKRGYSGKAPDDDLEFVAQPGGIDLNQGEHVLLKPHRFGQSCRAGVGERHNVTAAIRVAALTTDMPVQLKPCKSSAHGLRFNPGNFSQSSLRNGPFRSKDFHGDHAGMRQSDVLQFFIP